MRLTYELDYFEKQKTMDVVDTYYENARFANRKISDTKLIIDTLGDINMDSDLLKVFIYEIYRLEVEKQSKEYKNMKDVIKTIYDLVCDIKLPKACVANLFEMYHYNTYELYKDEIKEYLKSDDAKKTLNLRQKLSDYINMAEEYFKNEAEKLDAHKDELDSSFINNVKKSMMEYFISYEKVMSIIPSKKFIDSSSIDHKYLFDINSAETLVENRLSGLIPDSKFNSYSDNDKIILWYDVYEDKNIYTSFTKGEYLKDLKNKNKK